MIRRFAVKVVDLLRHEGGARRVAPSVRWSGYEHLRAALDAGRGALLVTPHLGNWEFGGSLLTSRGVRLLVLTQDEPGEGFTELRRRARERWGVETFVVGRDAFGFVEVVKRLQEGSTVALLVDRPPASSAVSVEFMGREFLASIAPAELARATGCAVLPVYVVAEGSGYEARVLDEVAYDRRALGSREARRRYAGEVMRAFEPVIRSYPDQWYHFVPLWNVANAKARSGEDAS
ncbi:MAG: lysophospholipid acyltransferase family protein [Verrucomicrobiales bacterium]|nr:lysophospholipid acyltransferase family protein [Verrucomicrobiales bacterium]